MSTSKAAAGFVNTASRCFASSSRLTSRHFSTTSTKLRRGETKEESDDYDPSIVVDGIGAYGELIEHEARTDTSKTPSPAQQKKKLTDQYYAHTVGDWKPTYQRATLPNPPPLPTTHGIHVATLRLYSNETQNLDFYSQFAYLSARSLGIPAKRPVGHPRNKELIAVPKSPFVHKKFQETFERITHKRSIKLYDANPETLDLWLRYIKKHSIGHVSMRADVYEWVDFGFGRKEIEGLEAQFDDVDSGNMEAIRKRAYELVKHMAGEEEANKLRSSSGPVIEEEGEAELDVEVEMESRLGASSESPELADKVSPVAERAEAPTAPPLTQDEFKVTQDPSTVSTEEPLTPALDSSLSQGGVSIKSTVDEPQSPKEAEEIALAEAEAEVEVTTPTQEPIVQSTLSSDLSSQIVEKAEAAPIPESKAQSPEPVSPKTPSTPASDNKTTSPSSTASVPTETETPSTLRPSALPETTVETTEEKMVEVSPALLLEPEQGTTSAEAAPSTETTSTAPTPEISVTATGESVEEKSKAETESAITDSVPSEPESAVESQAKAEAEEPVKKRRGRPAKPATTSEAEATEAPKKRVSKKKKDEVATAAAAAGTATPVGAEGEAETGGTTKKTRAKKTKKGEEGVSAETGNGSKAESE